MNEKMQRFSRPGGLVRVVWLVVLALFAAVGLGAVPAPRAGGAVGLPYTVADNAGNSWMIYQSGMLQQQGNMPIYSQGATLTVNGNSTTARNTQARLDEATGELIFENLPITNLGVTVTRRVLVDRDGGYVRYIDVFKNAQPREITLNVQLQSSLNYGVQSAQTVGDPRKKQDLAWVAQTQAGRVAVEVYAMTGAPVAPTINWPQGNSYAQALIPLTVGAGKSAALVHLHGVVASTEAGVKMVNDLKPRALLASVPKDIRKVIVNAPPASAFADMEILRGDVFDVVELRGGDQVKGTIKDAAFQLETFYGRVRLPADRVVAMVNSGQFRPRQLLVTADGQIFGGQLQQEAVTFELSSGQTTKVPLAQVSRFGFRVRPGEVEDSEAITMPLVFLRSGDRVGVEPPGAPIPLVTRYGQMQLDPVTVGSIYFQPETPGVHRVLLTDGSLFSGIVPQPTMQLKLAGGTVEGGSDQTGSFPSGAITRLRLTPKVAEVDDKTPTLQLQNEDTFVGTLAGQLKLNTAFDAIAINAAEVRKLNHSKDSNADVQVTLWDQTTVSGQLEDPQLQCKLNSGQTVIVPISLVVEYSQPQPKPSGTVVDRIKQLVANLNADDWQQRDRTEAALLGLGPAIAPVLIDLRPQQPAEAQQRIDHILAGFKGAKKGPEPAKD